MTITIPRFEDKMMWNEDIKRCESVYHDEGRRAQEVIAVSVIAKDLPNGEMVGAIEYYIGVNGVLAGKLLVLFGVPVIKWWGLVDEESNWGLQAVRTSDGGWRYCHKSEAVVRFVFEYRQLEHKKKPCVVRAHVHDTETMKEIFSVRIQRGEGKEVGRIIG